MMKNLWKWKLALGMLLTAGAANAALIYSWSGSVSLGSGTDDPWNVGSGTPFQISVSVLPGALDNDTNVYSALFLGDDVEVTYIVDGVVASVTPGFSPRRLRFSDDVVGSDYISLDFSAELFGSEQRILTSAAMSSSTFTYTDVLENPPVFASTLTHATTSSSAGIYWSTTPRQTPVIVSQSQTVNEPPVVTLLLLSLTMLAFRLKQF